MLVSGFNNLRVTFKNKDDSLEFWAINSGKDNDYVSIGRKLKQNFNKQLIPNGEFRNAELGHRIYISNTPKELQLNINNTSIVLDQIGENAFLPKPNPLVKYVRLQKDKKRNVVGIYLSGKHIKDLYYNLLSK